ncbi:glycine zipper family protein [Vibrio aestuarianus]|uniref:glycine zipper family protein n=1 Tax=Vibrio aestuarianus TaxID=28171 RepID=UPI00237CCD7C|nr:glycine zipper family protein [Vibrio aestuarianus]MDE1208843.1 glycine zipper family protein [Vibrio aestuarianus]MDE1252015.1 glycine zipper family protein [Vibrio aestuarianus]
MKKQQLLLSTLLIFTLPSLSYANIIVDTKNVDEQKYHADLYECDQLSNQVEQQQTYSLGHDVLGSTAKGAALGAVGSAIGGGSGSNGAKVGAGIGVIGGALKHGSEKRQAEQQYDIQKQNVMRNCMIGRGYTVLN